MYVLDVYGNYIVVLTTSRRPQDDPWQNRRGHPEYAYYSTRKEFLLNLFLFFPFCILFFGISPEQDIH